MLKKKGHSQKSGITSDKGSTSEQAEHASSLVADAVVATVSHTATQSNAPFYITPYFLELCCSCIHLLQALLRRFFSPLASIPRAALCMALLLAALAFPSLTTSPLQESSPVLRIVTSHHDQALAKQAPFGLGFEHDLVELFASTSRHTVQWLDTHSSAEALSMLLNDAADLAVGFTHMDHEAPHISASPIYAYRQSIAVQSKQGLIQRNGLPPSVEDAYMHTFPNSEAGDSIVLDDITWYLWQPFAYKNYTATPLDQGSQYRWYWNNIDATRHAQLENFWQARSQLQDSVIADLAEHYVTFAPSKLDKVELRHLHRVMVNRYPTYKKTIDDVAALHDIDPFLLTAVIFQESHFDPLAESYTGVRGIMQLTNATADFLNVDRLDPYQSIEGGARYLRRLWNNLDDLHLSYWNRWLFTLAAFNQGAGHLRDAIRLSQALGGTGRTWYEVKKVFPLLSQQRYYSRSRYGQCRGQEAVDFVDSIRWYYYIISGSKHFGIAI